MKDGLSQHDRHDRIHSVRPFTVIDDPMESLIRQAEILAGCIHYYQLSGKKEGDFSQFLDLAAELRDQNGNGWPDGEMEPSKALLLTFLKQLHGITNRFNKRWENYIDWYVNDCLKILPRTPAPDSVWLTFTRNTQKSIRIRKHTGFTFSGEENFGQIIYRATESVYLTHASVAKAYAIHFDRNNRIYPACLFDIPTALKRKDLLNRTKTSEVLFDEQVNPEHTRSVGLSISSPMLLLREGKRFVCLTFETEQAAIRNRQHLRNLVRLLWDLQEKEESGSRKDAKEVLLLKIFSDIFYLEISTPDGWSPVENYVIRQDKNGSVDPIRGLTLTFELHEDFPSTSPCSESIHEQISDDPVLRILLNRNAWLYPYSWLKEFQIARIRINTEVWGNHNVLFYNELGKVDTSIPFAPFGNNTEQGAWFAIGNYEMSIKNVQSAQVAITWQQLPSWEGGLFSWYQGYGQKIDNSSFKIRIRYLSDYKWKEVSTHQTLYLFSSVYGNKDNGPAPQQRLSEETHLKEIPLHEMKPVYREEEKYDYNIHSKSGFFSCVLEEPAMGFGEKTYRSLFSAQLVKKTMLKKKVNLLNPPITPLIERITLSYQATEEIDFRVCREDSRTVVSHIYPLGIRSVWPSTENKPVPFVFSFDTDSNLLIGLENIKGDEFIHLFIDFFPRKKEIAPSELPRVRWYWGNGYEWSVLPDDAILQNTTQNLLNSGKIQIYLPEIPSGNGFRDKEGIVWLRAGITQYEQSIPEINRLYVNAIEVRREQESMDRELPEGFLLDSSVESLPGIESIQQITPFKTGSPVENDEARLMRISEYITHRGRAVTARDYERITLQAFPQVGKVKCLAGTTDGMQRGVRLIILPHEKKRGIYFRPYASSDLLLEIEHYFTSLISGTVKVVDAVNPVYEEILVRCAVEFRFSELSKAHLRTAVKKVVNQTIAPWQQEGTLPVLGYTFTLQQLYDRICELEFVKHISHLSAVQLLHDRHRKYSFQEYLELNETIRPSSPCSILVPVRQHLVNTVVNKQFGIEEMSIHEHFIIWQNETEKH